MEHALIMQIMTQKDYYCSLPSGAKREYISRKDKDIYPIASKYFKASDQ